MKSFLGQSCEVNTQIIWEEVILEIGKWCTFFFFLYTLGCSRQEQVLNWLLEDNKFTTQSTNPISLRTRDGKVVTFEVKGQQRRQSGAGRGSEIGEAVKVVVKAPDYPTLTQLQQAVNQRIKVWIIGSFEEQLEKNGNKWSFKKKNYFIFLK